MHDVVIAIWFLTLMLAFSLSCLIDRNLAYGTEEDSSRNCPRAVYEGDGADKKYTFEAMNKVKSCYLDYNIDWYREHVRWGNILFRILGIFIAVGSILVPILNNIEFTKKWVNLVSIGVAICASLSGFFGWRENWAAYRAAQFQLEYLERIWQLEMVEADSLEGEAASTKAVEATRRLVESVFGVVSRETGSFFERVPAPKSSGSS